MFIQMWFLNFLVDIGRHLFYSKRIYRSNSCSERTISDLIDAIYSIKGIRLGMEVFRSHSIPLFLMNWETIVITQIEAVGMHGTDTCLTFTVYRWNWGCVQGKPIVPDHIQPNLTQKDTIHVLETNGNREADMYLKKMVELTLPLVGIDSQIIKVSKSVADAIVEDYNASSKAAKVYVLHGKPGCGKTTTLRLITKLVSGTLFADYNPTGVHAIRTIINQWESEMVIAYDEFDVSFEHIVCGKVTDKYLGLIPDAKDKASWNSLLDYIKRKQHVIFVMVTNKTFEEIQEMCNGDDSFLRYGRVDAHFIWPDGDDEVKKIDKKFSSQIEKKTGHTNQAIQIEDSARSDSIVSSHTTQTPHTRTSIGKKKWWDVPIKSSWRKI